ncbi:MAG TPA: HDOD domain-containing protein [Candidatus Hydrogenedentes bacterium]|nr:HDOD domain-containing protein [Candidatus Hydrogenedentota bacterium]HPG67202.1 HDOD domain-containing protein [Candidatus Hydrogenedentota bacterium]
MNRRDVILSRVKKAPPLPTITLRVFDLIGRADVDIDELLNVVQYDPGLTSNVLRLANSARFAASQTIRSLRDALVRLGTKQVSELILMSVVAPQTGVPVRGYDLPAGTLLEHSIAVAVCCDELANAVGVDAPDHVFTAGLLHDVGKIVLGAFVEIDAQPILDLAYQKHISFEEAESQVLGINHAEVGARLLENWGLPEPIVAGVRWHHRPEDFDEGDPLMVDLVHVADNLSLEAGIGVGADGLNYHPSHVATARLQLNTLALERVMSRMITRFEEVRDALLMGMK